MGDVVAIEEQLVVYRDVNIVLNKNPSQDAVRFAEYLKGEKSKQIFQQLGWSDKF
nr:hypothetical protein [Aeromonas dhakensis]